MKKHVLIYLIALILPVIAIQSCHTYVFDNVGEKIQGTWTMMPVEPGNNIQFVFTSDSVHVFENEVPATLINTDGKPLNAAGYTIEQNLTNHYLVIDPFKIEDFGLMSSMLVRTEKWLVITLTKEELYLQSIGKEGLKGEYQLHFFRNE